MKDRPESKKYARPCGDLKPEYDVIVIGSGYGGSIAASRMSRAGWNVCLLERGREFSPGEFPDGVEHAAMEMQLTLPDGQRTGPKTGLYNFHIGEDINVFWGCGLGGTSLVNANVALRPDPRVFEDPVWPRGLREDRQGIETALGHARDMLTPKTYPDDRPIPRKLASLAKSAEALGPFRKLEINVTFTDGPNVVGVEQRACTDCGDCVSGCNIGAKNTLAMNYIPDAFAHDAEIFTQIDVRYVEQEPGGWRVYYEALEGASSSNDEPLFLRAKMVFVCGGVLGSNEIMMRSKEHGLAVSDRLGERFSGNGDVLAFAYNCVEAIDSVGWGTEGLGHRPPVGPCIIGVIDLRDPESPLENGMVIEDGSVPSPLAHLIVGAFELAAATIGQDTDERFVDEIEGAAREAESLLAGPYTGAIRNTQVYLVMSQDDGKGTMRFENDNVRLTWPGVGSQPNFQRVSDSLLDATRALEGIYIRDPIWTNPLGKRLVTVHPLGGCAMGDSAAEGVVDHRCRCFKGNTGTEVHEGLYIVDGSVIPRPLGVNPLLTISSLAERCCKLAAEDRGRQVDYAFSPGAP